MPVRASFLARLAFPTAAVLTLAGCFTTAADFGDNAETYLLENDTLRAALFPESDTTFTTAECVDPENQDVGTAFTCTAVDSDGGAWEFDMVITGSSEYEVNVSRFPDGS